MPKTILIDSTPDIDPVWRQVHTSKDIPIAVNMAPVDEAAIPGLLSGYDTVIVDATYFNDATLKACKGLRHIVFLGTGAGSFIDLAAAERHGIKVSTIKGYGDTTVAEHAMGLVFAAARMSTMHDLPVIPRPIAPRRAPSRPASKIHASGCGSLQRRSASTCRQAMSGSRECRPAGT